MTVQDKEDGASEQKIGCATMPVTAARWIGRGGNIEQVASIGTRKEGRANT